MNFPKFMIRQTGGFAVGAISTRSSAASRAFCRASAIGTTPIASPSAPIRRTSFQRICSLTRMLFLSIFHLAILRAAGHRDQFLPLLGDRLTGGSEKLDQAHRSRVSAVAQAHGHRIRGRLLLADDQHARRLLHLGPTDARPELLVLVVDLDPQSRLGPPPFQLPGLS